MTDLKTGAALLSALLLWACEGPADPLAGGRIATKLPEELCSKTREAVAKLTESGGVETDGKGGATMMEEAWLRLSEGERDQTTQLLGYDAACRAGQPTLEQNVVIRSEYGRVMAERVVETSPDLSSMMAE